jgi:hypothetical protein
MNGRIQKQLLYGGIFVLVVLFVLGSIVVSILPDPSCADGKKNQNETGIDCGGVCVPCAIEAEDIEILETAILSSGSKNSYDVVARIKNPNDLFGSGEFSYTFEFLDENGSKISSFSDSAYILPAQERYLVAVNVAVSISPAEMRVVIGDVRWEKFSEYEAPKLPITNKTFERLSFGTLYAETKGLVRNESPYDFQTVEVFVVLRDASRNIIATGKTDMQTVRSGEKRDFSVFWDDAFSKEVMSVDAQATTNMFENQNFIKLFLPDGRFRNYE